MDREKEAWEELKRSSVSRGSRWVLVGVFLLAVFVISVVDLWHPYGPRDAVKIFTERLRPLEPEEGFLGRVRSWNREVLGDIESFEGQIEDESILGHTIPAYQWFMVRALGTSGTGRVLIGRDNWYFLKEGLETTLGWGETGKLREADAAVRRLVGMLAEKDIQLILVPIPGKADLYPGNFSSRFSADETLPQAPERERFYRSWESFPAVQVLPVGEILRAVQEDGRSSYLERDTHWSPAGMKAVANALAEALGKASAESPGPRETVSSPGDLVEMMRLPAPLTPNQEVETNPVQGKGRFDGSAEIVFLGDSFAAVYSDPVLGWGEGSGLQDLLPTLTQTPIDFRLNYGDPIAGPARQLERLLRTSNEQTLPKIIVWEFAERFIDEGEWDGLFR